MRSSAYSFSVAPIRAFRHQWIPALVNQPTFCRREWRLVATPLALFDPSSAGEFSWATLSASLLVLFLASFFVIAVAKWLARLRELTCELLSTADKLARELAEPEERSGYVPNVVYSCGALLHKRMLIIAYSLSDLKTSVARIDLDDLLRSMVEQ